MTPAEFATYALEIEDAVLTGGEQERVELIAALMHACLISNGFGHGMDIIARILEE